MNTSSEPQKNNTSPYPKFFLMMAVSFIVMYVVMYLNTYELDHVYFSLTRFYMTYLMIASMAILMLLFMLKMYKDKNINISIISIMNIFCAAMKCPLECADGTPHSRPDGQLRRFAAGCHLHGRHGRPLCVRQRRL